MKKIIICLLITSTCSFASAQVPDTTRRMKSAPQYRTDSVKHGAEIYNGNKTRKSKSNGDTLSTPKKTGKIKSR